MLGLGTVDLDIGELDLGLLDLGAGLKDVGLVDDAALETVGGDAKGFVVVRDCFSEEGDVGVVGAEVEVVLGELGLNGELDVLEVGGGGLGFFLGYVDLAADAAEEIDLVGERDGQLQVGDAVVDVAGVEVGLAGGIAQALGAGGGADGGVALGVLDADLGACFFKARGIGLDVLVLDAGFDFEQVQLGVGKEIPPIAADLRVVGCGKLPVGVFLVGVNVGVGGLVGGDDGLDVLWADFTAGREEGGGGQRQGYDGWFVS